MVEKPVKIYSLPTYQVKPDVFLVYSDNVSKSKIPIIIDNGSYLCKAGWIVNEKPPLVFRNVAAKHRGKKESETQVGNDIKNIEAVRWLLKTQFDKNVVTQFDVQETILDYIFNHLGINSNGAVNHPIVMSEAVCNPNYSRQLMSELLFECYNVPQVSYGVDSLFSFYNYNAKSKGLFGLVVSLGYNTCHVLPLVRSRFDVRNAKRISIGTSNMDGFFHRILQLKYSAHASAITLSRAESLIREHMLFSQDFMEDIRMWEKENYAKDNTHTVQLPYVPLPGSNSNNNSGKMEKCEVLLKRVQVMRLKQRSEKLAFDEEHLQECLSVQDLIEDGDDEAILALQELGYTSAAELQAGIKKLNCNIRKLKNLIAAQQDEPQESPFANWCEELNLSNFTDADSWLNAVKLKRKTMELEEKKEQIKILDEVLAEYEREFSKSQINFSFNLAEYYQLQIGVERIRIPEILFQPTMVGIEQAGLAETIEMVLARYSLSDQQKLAENVFITGGCAKLPFIKERIETELLAMRPFQSKFSVQLADDPLFDAWKGARKWALHDDNLKKFAVTRQEYEEKGGDYLKDHMCSNHYVALPPPVRKTIVQTAPPTVVKQEQKVT
ncbi:actin-related protein 5 [Trichonephila inaurata madagascariensis]|uniref:Actin-related protein 5 n=1 Tax=Trichonephila inaurata madagascariensis TaxID=2747483 RepID=A0A8X6XE06_9ARAC|nr:actin-related protein 5 [Trichonephila inaurata madagascariensis]